MQIKVLNQSQKTEKMEMLGGGLGREGREGGRRGKQIGDFYWRGLEVHGLL